MLSKKPKLYVTPHTEQKEEDRFVIPQIPENTVGLRVGKEQFQKTEALSPMEGHYTPDNMIVPENTIHQDIDSAYDAYRVHPKLTEEDEIRRYGSRYHEFHSIDQNIDTTKYNKPKEKEKSASSGIGISIGQVFDTIDEPTREEPKEPVMPNLNQPFVSTPPIIQFGGATNYSEPKEKVAFTSIEISNEITEETEESFVAQPNGRVPDFIQVKPQSVVRNEEDDYPKTIITHNPRRQAGPIEEPVNEPVIPPFVSEKEPTKEPRVFDAPDITPPNPNAVYDEIRNRVTPTEEALQPKVEPASMLKPKTDTAPKTIYADKYADYIYPPYSLLTPAAAASYEQPAWIEEKKEIINQTLSEFGIDGEVVKTTYGPSVTRYEVKLSSGVNVKKISQIEDNIKMSLSAKTIRIEAPIPGKSNVGIEVPNEKIRTVAFSEIVDRDEFKNCHKPLYVALGLDIDGNPIYTDIAKMPHGLVGGGTGSGKSVCINGILISLLLKNSPDDIRLILVDPKKVELISYQDLPHLITPVINDVKMASEALKWACEEMDRRYSAFATLRARDLATYNERIKNDPSMKKLQYIVIVIDELADLMMTCGADVEASIQRITQMGRACGIHIIVATQRPTTDVVKGTIKTNIPTRIAFRVPQFVDSNTILDSGGAENLLGRGDMLLKELDLPVRVQGAYISDDEIANVTDFIRDHYPADYVFTHDQLQDKIKDQYGANGNGGSGEDMGLLYEIATYVVTRGNCSINNIQNTYSLGFNRAQRIVDILQEMGIVSEKKGTTGREILVTQADVDQIFEKGE